MAVTEQQLTAPGVLGARVRSLREAMDLSLRDLAERSGVSAPMLSQVERGETSPTLQVATRIAHGLELRLSQLLRLDEQSSVTIVRSDERRVGPSTASRSPLRGADPAVAGSTGRAVTSHPDADARSRAAPATRRCTSRAAVRPRSSRRAR